jgi:hypothetical protein
MHHVGSTILMHQVRYIARIFRDTRSTKHKIPKGRRFLTSNRFRLFVNSLQYDIKITVAHGVLRE